MRAIILSICLLIGTQVALGQEKTKKTPEEKAKMQTGRLGKEITLNPDQQDKIYAINLEACQKIGNTRKNVQLTDDQKKEMVKTINMGRRKQVMEQLTAEQKETLKAKKKEHHKEHGDKQGKKTPEERAKLLADKLNKEVSLSQEQYDQILAITLKGGQSAEEIRKDAGLTEEQKKEKLKASRQSIRKEVMAVLTPEQQKIIKEKKKEHKQHKANKQEK